MVATTGTTGLGAVDPVDQIMPLCRRYGVRIHVDAAYGGFFRLIADDTTDGVAAAPFAAIADCDSVVLDPHKHGLQPYGCGPCCLLTREWPRTTCMTRRTPTSPLTSCIGSESPPK